MKALVKKGQALVRQCQRLRVCVQAKQLPVRRALFQDSPGMSTGANGRIHI